MEECGGFITPSLSFTQSMVGGMHLSHGKNRLTPVIGVVVMPVSNTQIFGSECACTYRCSFSPSLRCWEPGYFSPHFCLSSKMKERRLGRDFFKCLSFCFFNGATLNKPDTSRTVTCLCRTHLCRTCLCSQDMSWTVGGCLAVRAQWQSTGASSQWCPGFDSW